MSFIASKDRSLALSGTLVFHVVAIILLALLMRTCQTTGGGSGDGLGYMALAVAGLGEPDQGGPSEAAPDQQAEQSTPQQITEDQPVESQAESAVTVVKTESKPKPTVTPTPKPDDKPKTSKGADLIKGTANTQGQGQGDGPKPGNQGLPDGNINGKGIFHGIGSEGEWSLNGRAMSVKPSLSEKPKDEGRVVVDIKVDRDGKVIYAKANPALSNTTNSDLYALAEKAARTARFNEDQTKGVQQSGTITIIFTLN